MTAATVSAMLSTQILIEGDAVRLVGSKDDAPIYVIAEVDETDRNGWTVRKYRLRRDSDGKLLGRRYGRTQLVVVGLTVEVDGKIIAGREQWR